MKVLNGRACEGFRMPAAQRLVIKPPLREFCSLVVEMRARRSPPDQAAFGAFASTAEFAPEERGRPGGGLPSFSAG
jgi:hypothetical protein